jgi:hypothetical protein
VRLGLGIVAGGHDRCASGAYEAVRAVIDCGRLEVVYMHVTGDELALMPNADGRLVWYRPSSISGALSRPRPLPLIPQS